MQRLSATLSLRSYNAAHPDSDHTDSHHEESCLAKAASPVGWHVLLYLMVTHAAVHTSRVLLERMSEKFYAYTIALAPMNLARSY